VTDVVVIGSLNLDLVVPVPRLPQPGETVAGPSAERLPGGKGANQAVAASRLGGHVRLAGLVGDDAFGADLRQTVAEHGVDVSQVGVLEGTSTGTAFITIEDGGEIVVATRVLQLRTEQRQRRSQLMRGMRNETPLHGGLPFYPRNALIDRIHNGPQLALKMLRTQRHEFVRRAVAHVVGQRHQVPQFKGQADAHQHDRNRNDLREVQQLRPP